MHVDSEDQIKGKQDKVSQSTLGLSAVSQSTDCANCSADIAPATL